MLLFFGLFIVSFLRRVTASEAGFESLTVEAVAGYSAEIPCNVPTPLADDEASLILWYRMDVPNPIYTLDVRNLPISGARHFPATEMEDRAYFNVTVHPPVLVLHSITADDEADYRCRVDLKRSRTLILHCHLDVIVPPGIPIIMDEHGQHLHDIIGPYDEGASLTFICEVDGGNPSPEVTWWRGTSLVDDSYNATEQGFVRNDLIVEDIQREDLMSGYQCKASNNNLTAPKEASLQVDMNLFPLDVKIIMPDLPILSGVEQTIFCETVGSRPNALTSWWLDDDQIGSLATESHSEDGNVTTSALKITLAPEANEKTLTCKTTNPVSSKSPIKVETSLNVQYLPLLSLRFGRSVIENEVKEGSDVYLECNVSSNPEVYNVTWEFEEQLIATNLVLGVVILNHTLLLQKVRKEQQGRYRCNGTNTVGTGSSNVLFLFVQFVPVCKYAEPMFYGVSPEEYVNLTCDLLANPSEVEFQWSFNGSIIDERMQNEISETNVSVVRYSPVTEDGYGIFQCWGRNTLGYQEQPCVFKVVPAGPPEPLHDCIVTNRTSHSVTVDCRPGYNGSLPQYFHIEIYNSIAENIVNNITNGDSPSFQVTGLSSDTSYVLVIYSSNSKGRSKSLALVGATLPAAKRRTAREIPTIINPVIWISTGVVLFILVASIVIMSVIKSRKIRKRSKKDASRKYLKTECKMDKRELEESQDPNEMGPDIIPFSKEPEVFHLDGFMEDACRAECLQKTDSPPTEYIRLKYMHTVL